MTIDDKLLSLREEIEVRERKLSHELVKGRENLYPYCLWQREKEEYEQFADWLEELKFLRTAKETMYHEIYEKGRNDAIEEFIKIAEEERDDILNWDDDEYENGMRAGYQYSIEIAEKMKDSKK